MTEHERDVLGDMAKQLGLRVIGSFPKGGGLLIDPDDGGDPYRWNPIKKEKTGASMNTPETAPKDMTVFLGDFGFPWMLPTVWNPLEEYFVTLSLQINMVNGEHNDPYFEQETYNASYLKGWLPLPEKTVSKE